MKKKMVEYPFKLHKYAYILLGVHFKVWNGL